MAKETITGVKGMPDFLPERALLLEVLEQFIRDSVMEYGYQPIRLPIVERTNLFVRSVGEVTDIVEKEIYTFNDRNEESLALRPEGTAGCVRACIEHNLLRNNQQQRLWYLGNMYRYEQPQKGRHRQFNQLGVEAFNIPTPDIDAEQIAMMQRFWDRLDLHNVRLEINSLGSSSARAKYREDLVAYFQQNHDVLDDDSKRRLTTNPLRILDSKNPDMQSMLEAAPSILDYLEPECAQHFADLQKYLDALDIDYEVNPRLVRGLDYYNRTVYEWISDDLGAQSTICAGGRYDGLVEQLGGPASTAVGFAMGIERVLLLLEQQQSNLPSLDAYLICTGEEAGMAKLLIAEQVREHLPGYSVKTHFGGGNFSKLMQKADKSGAEVVLIVGDEELANDTITIKYLRGESRQETVTLQDLANIEIGG